MFTKDQKDFAKKVIKKADKHYRNATSDEYKSLPNTLEYYYNCSPSYKRTDQDCPICGCRMYKKYDDTNRDGEHLSRPRYIVGGHIFNKNDGLVYILPICNVCNDEKENKGWFGLDEEAEKRLQRAP